MRVSSGWFLSGFAAVFVAVLVAVLALNDRGASSSPIVAAPVAAPVDPLPRVKSRPLVSDQWAGKPRNDAVDSGTASKARARLARAQQAAASPEPKPALTPVAAPISATPVSTPISTTAATTTSTPQAAAPSIAAPKKRARPTKRKIRPSFKRGVLRTPDLTIRITRYAVIPAGQDGNVDGEKPVIAFWYRTTNVSGDKTSAADAFRYAFRAYQDTDANTENELDSSFMFATSAESEETIKKGRTVSHVRAFELDDLTTPVELVGTEDLGEPIGKTRYRLK